MDRAGGCRRTRQAKLPWLGVGTEAVGGGTEGLTLNSSNSVPWGNCPPRGSAV